ncbi:MULTISPECIES: iron chelate uptake ABC transporter family permease subunit [Arsenicicoccus]|uniref:iron chelate uptake ABC transporter family permease subunit n=1 Tax=Arsenicicoccus TaxID=267408 RepID=UPI00257F1D83|nr:MULTISPECIES: iron chelate uptake ABC transporter family permease subunit [Arsenicicoccus]
MSAEPLTDKPIAPVEPVEPWRRQVEAAATRRSCGGWRRAPGLRVAGWWALAAAAATAYVLWGLDLRTIDQTTLEFILPRRLTTLATMTVVGVGVALATVLFHTVTANRILTPSIMGFDALYLLVQTGTVVLLGVTGSLTLDPVSSFAWQATAMTLLAVALYRWLLVGLGRSLHMVVLVGVVIGGFFRALSTLMQRAMDPTEFIVLQDRFFADFHGADLRLVGVTAVIVALAAAWTIWRAGRLDVLALGRDIAVSLGLDHRRGQLAVLALVALLVAAATALVGPTSFFGLLVAHLAYQTVGTHRHAHVVPAACGAAVVTLVGGQLVLEKALGLEGSLSLVVELLGGVTFLVLLLRRARA